VMVTVLVGGATCSGKTSLARLLVSILPRSRVLHQDDYYHGDESPLHVRDESGNINWEVAQAFDMSRLQEDMQTTAQQLAGLPLSSSTEQGCRAAGQRLLGGGEAGREYSVVCTQPVLLVEGIAILGSAGLRDLGHLKAADRNIGCRIYCFH